MNVDVGKAPYGERAAGQKRHAEQTKGTEKMQDFNSANLNR
jgi:hypothetical protein